MLTEGRTVIILSAGNDRLLYLGGGYLLFSVSCVYYTTILKYRTNKGQGPGIPPTHGQEGPRRSKKSVRGQTREGSHNLNAATHSLPVTLHADTGLQLSFKRIYFCIIPLPVLPQVFDKETKAWRSFPKPQAKSLAGPTTSSGQLSALT